MEDFLTKARLAPRWIWFAAFLCLARAAFAGYEVLNEKWLGFLPGWVALLFFVSFAIALLSGETVIRPIIPLVAFSEIVGSIFFYMTAQYVLADVANRDQTVDTVELVVANISTKFIAIWLVIVAFWTMLLYIIFRASRYHFTQQSPPESF